MSDKIFDEESDFLTMENQTILAEINRRWMDERLVRIKVSKEGQGVTDDGVFVLGCRAGPSLSIDHLLHEMCHLAELEVERVVQRPSIGWGLRPGKFWMIGHHSGYEPQTDQGLWREARVWAYQLALSRELGIPVDPLRLVSVAQYLPQFCYLQYSKEHQFSDENEALTFLSKIVNEWSRGHFSFPRWELEWNKRMNALTNAKKENSN